MNLSFFLPLLGFFLILSPLGAQTRTTSADLEAEGKLVRLRPDRGMLNVGQTFIITFPQSMVANEAIDTEGQESPLVFDPPLKGTFFWKSASEGQFQVEGPLIPGQTYQAGLQPALLDVNGNAVPKPEWDSEFKTEALEAKVTYRDQGDALDALPQIPIRFTYPVTIANAMGAVYFQDRDTRERYPVDLVLHGISTVSIDEEVPSPSITDYLTVTPAEPLRIDRTFDLIIEGLRDAATDTPMRLIKVVALGNTRPLSVESATASAPPLEKASIRLMMSAPVDSETLTPETISVEPEVSELRYNTHYSSIQLTGNFDPHTTYTVRLGSGIRGTGGFALAEPYEAEVAFEGYTPTIDFPQTQFYQRSQTGLNIVFLQANCGETTWRLSPVPMEKLHLVSSRLKEYFDGEIDPFTGIGRPKVTELLTDAFSLEPLAEGSFPALGSVEAEYRNVSWKPEEGAIPSGPYLLEASAETSTGKIVGNRSLIFFNEVLVVRKLTETDSVIKVMDMAEGEPVADATVEVTDEANTLIASGQTDGEGVVSFSRMDLRNGDFRPVYVKVVSSAGTATQPFYGQQFYNSAWMRSDISENLETAEPEILASLITDRNLYRPGHEVRVKGILRSESPDPHSPNRLSIPDQPTVKWWITEGYDGERMAEGEADLDEFGSFDTKWEIPESAKLGTYFVNCALPSHAPDEIHRQAFEIEEYRVPLFSVDLGVESKVAEKSVEMKIQSNYFHGGPNTAALARWTAHWSPYTRYDDGFSESDTHSPERTDSLASRSSEGEIRLDEFGSASLTLENPFPQPLNESRFYIYVTADVISPEGQTISSAVGLETMAFAQVPRIRITGVEKDKTLEPSESPKPSESEVSEVKVEFEALGADDKPILGLPATLQLYFVETKSVKERLGPGVYRYRNFPEYTLIEERAITTGESPVFPAERTGSYVAVGKLTEAPDTPTVSDQVNSAGDGDGYYEVYNDAQFAIQADKDEYAPGDTAELMLEAPFGGQAWVSLETNGIIDHFIADIPSNGTPIQVPIKQHYHPNIFATVYLMKPGGSENLPMERFGNINLKVNRPDLQLEVKAELTKSEVEPGSPVSGVVFITQEGKALPDTDVTLFAVDDAVLQLGLWTKPDLVNAFYKNRPHQVSTYRALIDHYESFDESEVVEKGFVIGGGGAASAPVDNSQIRKDFKPLAFWQTNLRSDENGAVPFEFNAPDNLTRFRIVAVAQTKDSKFGTGEATFTVAKRLIVEPALPRFARTGDIMEFRTVIRQDYVDQMSVQVRCVISGGVRWLGDDQERTLALLKGVPNVLRFPAEITSTEPIKVRFEATSLDHADIMDGVELELPVSVPGILQNTGHFGEITLGEEEVDLGALLPDVWKDTSGSFNLTVSYTPYLPELNSLPEVLEYPHGCLEQKSTRYLTYTILEDLLDYLPELKNRHMNYQARLEGGLQEYDRSLLPNGLLPYWPMSEGTNPWVTVMAYWVMVKAQDDGYTIPPRLAEQLPKAIDAIIRSTGREQHSHMTRAFALFVRSEANLPAADYQAVFNDFHSLRATLSSETLAFLCIATKNHGIMETERTEWLTQLPQMDGITDDVSFDPSTFTSPWRRHAIGLLAHIRMTDDPARIAELSNIFLNHDSESGTAMFSTQENFWRLLAMKSLMDQQAAVRFDADNLTPTADFVSTNGASVSWKTQALEQTNDLVINHEAEESAPAWYLVNAKVLRTDGGAEEKEDHGFRVERVTKNLTDASRNGSADSPFAIGDEVLITYRFESTRNQHYVALTDELPAGFETVNFNLPQVAQFYQLPTEANSTLWLNHSELRDQSANLYFNYVQAGLNHYSILARVTAVGEFTWPSTQVAPMYQPYFHGLSATTQVFSTDQ